MGVGTSIVVFAIGAILRFATSVSSSSFNIHTIGVILMVVGVVGSVVSLAFWSSWGGFWWLQPAPAASTGMAPHAPVVDETHRASY